MIIFKSHSTTRVKVATGNHYYFTGNFCNQEFKHLPFHLPCQLCKLSYPITHLDGQSVPALPSRYLKSLYLVLSGELLIIIFKSHSQQAKLGECVKVRGVRCKYSGTCFKDHLSIKTTYLLRPPFFS